VALGQDETDFSLQKEPWKQLVAKWGGGWSRPMFLWGSGMGGTSLLVAPVSEGRATSAAGFP